MRDIVEFQVEKHVEAELFERSNDLWALGVKKRHTDFEPPGMTGEGVGELQGALAVTIKRDDYAVAGIID